MKLSKFLKSQRVLDNSRGWQKWYLDLYNEAPIYTEKYGDWSFELLTPNSKSHLYSLVKEKCWTILRYKGIIIKQKHDEYIEVGWLLTRSWKDGVNVLEKHNV